jgi:ABC-type amino acid transport substrate-binding protein
MNKQKQYFTLISLVCLFLLLLSSKVIADNETTILTNNNEVNEIEAIVKRGKLIVAMYSEDTPPFYFVDNNNQLTGIDVALIKGFADMLGVKVEFDRSAKFLDDVVDKVEKHQADLAICKLSMTFSRVKRVLFTRPYIRLHQGLLINRLRLAQQLNGRSREETIQNLTGKIGVVAKSSYVKYANQKFKHAEVVEYPTWNDVVNDVLKGNIVGAYRDEAEIKMIVRDRPDTALQLLSVVLKDAEDPKGIAVALKHRNLKDLLNFYIESLDLNLTVDKVLKDYDDVIKSIATKTK